MYTIDINKLMDKYPGYWWIDKGAELCGYNPMANTWIVIDDGMCRSHDGKWIVHNYILPKGLDPIKEHCKYLGVENKPFPETREKLIY